MKILIIEPYFTGSHKAWAREYAHYSSHDVKILSLPGNFWKWRMHGGAITLARKFLALDFKPDVLFVSDMLNLPLFQSLTRRILPTIPTAIYFHENQITYPWSENDRDIEKNRDYHYGFINIASAFVADRVFFNSRFHLDSFLSACKPFLKNFPDFQELEMIDVVSQKSAVLPLGLDLQRLNSGHEAALELRKKFNLQVPVLLWNHRWEYDKNPQEFFEILMALAKKGLDFKIVVLGENFQQKPTIFDRAREQLDHRILQWGYVETIEEYAQWLWLSDILPITSHHDFFGASVVEAAYCGVMPMLPRRLSYPEIFSGEDCFYDDTKDLFSKLEKMIRTFPPSDLLSMQNRIEKFDWRVMANEYDKMVAIIRPQITD